MYILKFIVFSVLLTSSVIKSMELLRNGVDPKSASLHEAAKNNDLFYLHRHLNHDDPKVNEKDNDGRTPLMVAIMHGHLQAVEELVQVHGANLKCADAQGRTALHIAVSSGLNSKEIRKKIALFLMKEYSNKNMIDLVTRIGMTPFHLAILHGQTSMALTLMSYGADKEAEDNVGITPLEYAQAKLKGEQAKLEKAQEELKTQKLLNAEYSILEELKTREKIAAVNVKKYTKLVDCIRIALAATHRITRKQAPQENEDESPETAAAQRTTMLRTLLRAQRTIGSSDSLSTNSFNNESDAEEDNSSSE